MTLLNSEKTKEVVRIFSSMVDYSSVFRKV